MDRERIERAYEKIKTALFAGQTPDGYWVGELSSSALATATALGALALVDWRNDDTKHRDWIQRGVDWLTANQNEDGGWGDTTRSKSNISTTLLVRAAIDIVDTPHEPFRGEGWIKDVTAAMFDEEAPPPTSEKEAFLKELAKKTRQRVQVDYWKTTERCERWLHARYGAAEAWPEAVRARYGKDRTFAVPILTMCALAKLVSWNEVPRLPFELACIPQKWYRYAKLPVVSYALPALIAIGQCVHHHRSKWNPITRFTRWIARKRSLTVLRNIQPTSGGYLEATPLTAFVTMSLASLPRDPISDEVIASGVKFLEESMRPDGSWPIDTNLSTWVTTLAVNAFAAADDLESLPHKDKIAQWLLDQQGKERHPYTGADPGGWAWTPLSGGVPDCDDTPGALIALKHLGVADGPAIQNGIRWLLDIQNKDGGWPTFCKGWGVLPFDRSGSDLAAHSLRALIAWGGRIKFGDAIRRGQNYLIQHQRADGSWLPLWFGNQDAIDDINPLYGTSRVLEFYDASSDDRREFDKEIVKLHPEYAHITSSPPPDVESVPAWDFIKFNQNADGGWGGLKGCPSSFEETALALNSFPSVAYYDLEGAYKRELDDGDDMDVFGTVAIMRGLEWLCAAVERDAHLAATPIGFYFAKLWYFEKLYPLVFALAALGKARRANAVGDEP